MNIKQAKEQIFNAITAYRTRDEHGRSVIPQHRQRPVFLLGAPGIGKTAIMEQIAQEMGIPLVSYSMTHHTRQSALGLPFICDKEYGGKSFRVSEYTMSEIIAAVYERMEQTGAEEGILFLDEINCVSETLAPAMLQFLQYKVFGQHKVPDGWIVVTAGNPPEYNNSVREFDMVTWDRLKRIDVEPDYSVWRNWAVDQSVHAAILSFLDIRKGDFYRVESTVDGKRFVTPRGWVDLSDMIKLYEQHNIKVDLELVAQYLQDAEISRAFANYYDLWLKYRGDYQIESILNGNASPKIKERAKKGDFNERISLVGLIMDAILGEIRQVMNGYSVQEALKPVIKEIRISNSYRKKPISEAVRVALDGQKKKLEVGIAGGMLAREAENIMHDVIGFLQDCQAKIIDGMSAEEAYNVLKDAFDARTRSLKKSVVATSAHLENIFLFAEEVFGEGQEMLIIVTELTAAGDSARFIAQFNSPGYFRHNAQLLFYERQIQVISEINRIEELLNLNESLPNAGQP